MGTVVDLIRARVADDGVAVMVDERHWTWRETVCRAEHIARCLVAQRRPGPFHVGLLMDNSPAYLFTLFGAALAGGVSVGINNTRRGDQLAIDIRHSDCQVLMTDESNAVLLEGLDLGDARIEVVSPAAPTDDEPADLPIVAEISEESLFTLIFTSGSTGTPKAVRMSHGRAYELAERWSSATPDDVVYCAIPLFHANALTAMALPALRSGAAIADTGPILGIELHARHPPLRCDVLQHRRPRARVRPRHATHRIGPRPSREVRSRRGSVTS